MIEMIVGNQNQVDIAKFFSRLGGRMWAGIRRISVQAEVGVSEDALACSFDQNSAVADHGDLH